MEEIIKKQLEQCRAEYCFSGYQLVVNQREKTVLALCGGRTSYWPEATEVTDSTYFDIGSVTKVVTTASIFARAVQRGDVTLADPIKKFLPAFVSSPLGNLEIRHCLTHSTGLVGWSEIFKDKPAAGELNLSDWFLAMESKIIAKNVGEVAVYSDLGILLLKLVIERIWGSVDVAFRDEVAVPLGLATTTYLPLPDGANVAATEFCGWRQRLLQGEVFDENTAVLGNISSHAGLFSTASELAKVGDRWLGCLRGESPWLNAETAKLFTKRANVVEGSSWALGWDTKSAAFSSLGDHFSKDSFGHLGYPGCSLWVDPVNDVSIAFLTNRIHPSRFDERIKRIRPEVHNGIAKYLGIAA